MAKRKTQDEFVKEVKDKFHEEYDVLGQYINNRTKILIRHNKCGNSFMKNPKDMVTKLSGCPYCNGSKPALYNEQWVIVNTPEPYEYISGYTKMSEKCKFYCHKCNSNFMQSPSRLINEHIYGCNCCPTKLKAHEEFLKELGNSCLNEYDVLDKYINIDTPILFRHKKCGTQFNISPFRFIYDNKKEYCPVCYYRKSKGEVKIAESLTKMQIYYEKEYTFNDLPKKRFDFYVPSLNTCIEFDGKQHFEKNDFFGGEKNFLETQSRDIEKNMYCIKNNITLFRIPYTDINNIDVILTKIFKEKSSETIEKYKIY